MMLVLVFISNGVKPNQIQLPFMLAIQVMKKRMKMEILVCISSQYFPEKKFIFILAEKKDIEKGSGSTNKPPKPRQDEIVPIYRRDCHEEVYAGSHVYPGHGVYLLKFDNSYSLWRSKTLYYRVYYSK
jgi:hypothetical protein